MSAEFDEGQDPEIRLRAIWTRKGIPEAVQDEMIAEVTRKAAPGAQVGPWTIPERRVKP